MTFPHLIENSYGFTDAFAAIRWASANVETVKTALAAEGAVLFRGFPIQTAADFDGFSAAFGYGDFTYKESLSNAVRINRTARVFTANEAPPDVEIFLHHELAQTPIYPQKIFFCCLSPAEKGGATPVCRSDDLFLAFSTRHPVWADRFRQLGVRYTTWMPGRDDAGSGQGRSWRSTLGASGRADAEARLAGLGYTWIWVENDSLLATTPVLPAVRRLENGRESFFNQVIAAYRGWERRAGDSKPLLTFGNGAEIPADALDALVETSLEFITPLEWQQGDIALVDNYRVMHGRYPYSGSRKREVLVCLATE